LGLALSDDGSIEIGYISLFTGDARGARDAFEHAAQHAKSIRDPESAVRLAEASRKLVAALDVALRSPCGPNLPRRNAGHG
jgi:hypothetical protein